MAIFEYVGCPPPPQGLGCMGPPQHWALFGISLTTYPNMIFISLILSFVVFWILPKIDKKIDLSLKKRIIISIISFIVILILEMCYFYWYLGRIIY